MAKKIGLFVEKESTKSRVKSIQEKLNKPVKVKEAKTAVKSKSSSLEDLKSMAESLTIETLSYYKDRVKVIRDLTEFQNYINDAIELNVIAVDTETNKSLDPLTCKLMGLCCYHPGDKAIYVPVNHTDLNHELLPNQLTCEEIGRELDRLSNTNIIMHNGKFDYEVIKMTCNSDLDVWWDTLLGAQILNENESAKLKVQYMLHIDSTVGKYSIEGLYKNIGYEYIDPEVFALYAATDALMTYDLQKWQEEQFNLPGHERIYKLFKDVEMKVLKVAAGMELRGISIDFEIAKRLSNKYHKLCDDVNLKLDEELKKLEPLIEEWRKTPEANFHPKKKASDEDAKSKSEQLHSPPELSSPTQFAIILYDILKVGVIDKDTPRGTGEAIITKIDHPICKLVLEKRGLEKLINTYIDKLPSCVNEFDGRLHAHFNQMGTESNNVKTGRFSSSDPNLNLWALIQQ